MKIFVLNWKDRMRVYKITIEEDLGVALPNHFSKTEIVARDDRYDTKSAAREEFFARYVAYDFHDSCILMNAIDESFLEVEELHGVDKVIGYTRSITPNVLNMLFFFWGSWALWLFYRGASKSGGLIASMFLLGGYGIWTFMRDNARLKRYVHLLELTKKHKEAQAQGLRPHGKRESEYLYEEDQNNPEIPKGVIT
jgi:hypothetical protein